LKQKGFVIYPGKISQADTFRIGTIGDINGRDIEAFIGAVSSIRKTNPATGIFMLKADGGKTKEGGTAQCGSHPL
jgi:aspartate aminotransferase-like enzyme